MHTQAFGPFGCGVSVLLLIYFFPFVFNRKEKLNISATLGFLSFSCRHAAFILQVFFATRLLLLAPFVLFSSWIYYMNSFIVRVGIFLNPCAFFRLVENCPDISFAALFEWSLHSVKEKLQSETVGWE